jgi:tetratricopeptide (TPR) repeat protein
MVYSTLGKIYLGEKNYNLALRYFEGGLEQSPPKGNHHNIDLLYQELRKQSANYIGTIYAQQNDILRSLTYFCKALTIDLNYKDASTNFNYAASVIQGLDNKSFTLLHNQMLQGNIFKPSLVKDNITIQNKDCSFQQGCILTFNANLKQNEFLFPFLIYASTPNGEVVRIRYSAFNQTKQGYQIALGIDHQFGNSAIHFYIPTCDGIYYETKTQ